MAVSKPTKPKKSIHLGWRDLAVFLLTFFGLVFFVGFTLVHWTERQLFNTDNWVKLVAPLPKNDQVATALSTYSVNKLFNGIDLEQKVSDALPDRASFLADPLVDRLQQRTQGLTKRIIQGDRFQTIWITANKTAHQKLMDSARGTAKPPPKLKTNFNLDLSPVLDSIKSRLGNRGSSLFANSSTNSSNNQESIKASVSTKLSTFKKFVKSVDFLNSVLWLLALVCLVGAIVLTHFRRRLLLIIFGTILVISLLQLIGLKAVRPTILNHIENQSFRPAIRVIYDSLTNNFRHSATVIAVVSTIILIITFFTQKKFLKRSKFIDKELKRFLRSSVYKFISQSRIAIRQHWLPIAGAIILIGLVLGAFAFELDWPGVLRMTLMVILAIELMSLVASRNKIQQPRGSPM